MTDLHKIIQHYPIGGENALKAINEDGSIFKVVYGPTVNYNKMTLPVNVIDMFLERENLYYKPLLRPMSDLYRKIDGKIGIVELAKIYDKDIEWTVGTNVKDIYTVFDSKDKLHRFHYFAEDYTIGIEDNCRDNLVKNTLRYYQWLFNQHYDVFDLISQGKAIDINTVKK